MKTKGLNSNIRSLAQGQANAKLKPLKVKIPRSTRLRGIVMSIVGFNLSVNLVDFNNLTSDCTKLY